MNKPQLEKIKKFLADKVMTEAVKQVLLDACFSQKGARDVHVLASERLAVDIIQAGFKDLDNLTKKDEGEKTEIEQVGL